MSLSPREQDIAIPPAPVLRAVGITAAVCVLVAAGASRWVPGTSGAAWAAGLGAGAAGLVTGLSALFFASARPRPASLCGSFWLAATLARFLLIPAVCLSIHWSAPEAGLTPVLATVGAYLACLAAETATVVRLVHRSLDETPR
jgi:hypothetical protein